MNYHFEFTSAYKDLIDSYTAVKNSSSGLSGWSRGALLILGLMWLLGFLFSTSVDGEILRSLIWLALGACIIWWLGFKPYLEKKHIKDTNSEEQKVTLMFTDEGINAVSESGGAVLRDWREVDVIENSKKGVFIGFSDGIMNWLPNRVFVSKKEKKEFIDAAITKLYAIEQP